MSSERSVELLAPAGGWEQLSYALTFGADAVYLACDRFGLRVRAANFTCEELPAVVEQVHAAGAKAYVTCNAFAHDDDLTDLPPYVEAIRDAGVDAVIVSDLGVLAVVQQYAPDMTIHVSTQASVSNAAAANMWYRLGARRIVCAREMSCAEIAVMRKEIPDDLELEVFVHGAMCMAVSGRCLISDYMTGRAANKGQCVQPCRWEYRLSEPSRPGQEFGVEEDAQGTYLMNSKDLNLLSHLDELKVAGVDSIKIEGRVKKAFYVATVVNAYRHVLDGEDPEKWQDELDTISHRPYSTGFYFGSAEQSIDADMYQQLYDWVGEVVTSWPQAASVDEPDQDSDQWRVVAKCRNRFYEGDALEILSPGNPVRSFVVRDLAEAYGIDSLGMDVPLPEGQSPYTEAKCDTACKAMDPYAFMCPYPLRAHDILRVKRKDPSRKN